MPADSDNVYRTYFPYLHNGGFYFPHPVDFSKILKKGYANCRPRLYQKGSALHPGAKIFGVS